MAFSEQIEKESSRFTLSTIFSANSIDNSDFQEFIYENKRMAQNYRNNCKLIYKIYQRAYQLLCDTIGEDNITYPIDIFKVAQKCHISITEKPSGYYYLEDESQIRKAAKYFTIYSEGELEIKRALTGENINLCISNFHINGTSNNYTRYLIAYAIGKIVFRDYAINGYETIYDYVPSELTRVNENEFLAKTFALALLIPSKVFTLLEQEYVAIRTNWPLLFPSFIAWLRDKTQVPEYICVNAYRTWSDYKIAESALEAAKKVNEFSYAFKISIAKLLHYKIGTKNDIAHFFGITLEDINAINNGFFDMQENSIGAVLNTLINLYSVNPSEICSELQLSKNMLSNIQGNSIIENSELIKILLSYGLKIATIAMWLNISKDDILNACGPMNDKERELINEYCRIYCEDYPTLNNDITMLCKNYKLSLKKEEN